MVSKENLKYVDSPKVKYLQLKNQERKKLFFFPFIFFLKDWFLCVERNIYLFFPFIDAFIVWFLYVPWAGIGSPTFVYKENTLANWDSQLGCRKKTKQTNKISSIAQKITFTAPFLHSTFPKILFISHYTNFLKP